MGLSAVSGQIQQFILNIDEIRGKEAKKQKIVTNITRISQELLRINKLCHEILLRINAMELGCKDSCELLTDECKLVVTV